MEEVKNRKTNTLKAYLWSFPSLLLICLIVIIYEAISLYNDNKEYAIADTEYERILNNNTGVSTVQKATPTEEGETFPDLGISYSTLRAINPDFVSWLYFPYFDYFLFSYL